MCGSTADNMSVYAALPQRKRACEGELQRKRVCGSAVEKMSVCAAEPQRKRECAALPQ